MNGLIEKAIKRILILSLGTLVLVACQSVTSTGSTQTQDVKPIFVPEPTLEGSWAGLPYDENWEFRVVDADEEPENPYQLRYYEGQEILVNTNYAGCELTYWFGGTVVDEFGEDPETFSYSIGYQKTINDGDFVISLTLISGKLDFISYKFFSDIRNASNVFENGYLGSFLLRLDDTKIDPCIRETEWLLGEIDTSGIYSMKETFYEWDNERRFGVP